MIQPQQKPAGFIFRCSNSTQDECFQRQLFGEKPHPKYALMLSQVRKGDPLFLYNVTSERLYGEFAAISDGTRNIESDAWDGGFPLQVRVTRTKEYHPLLRQDFENLISFRGSPRNRYPTSFLTITQLEELRELFEQAEELPPEEYEFRKKFPANIYTDDGHRVRSYGEVMIDNWLFKQEIAHGYERKVPIQEVLYSDFHLHQEEKSKFAYIEYWGIEDESYRKRKEHKIKLYNKHDLPLIQLTRKDLEILDDIMPRKVRLYRPNHKFK